MKINHNIPALRTLNSLNKADQYGSKVMQRLSTGLRINTAADDAAGLAIANKMDTQIRGLRQANRNTMDGISYIQTAEGACNEVHAMLQRMREITVQASNGTYQTNQKNNIQAEINELREAIKEIQKNSQFNGKQLLGNGKIPVYVQPTEISSGTVTVVNKDTVDAIVMGDLNVEGEAIVTGDVKGNVTWTGASGNKEITIGGDVGGNIVSTSPADRFDKVVVSGNVKNGGNETTTAVEANTVVIGGDVTGDVLAYKDIYVKGDVKGNVTLSGDGNIELLGDITGNVKVTGDGNIIIKGNVTGNITLQGDGDIILDGKITGTVEIIGAGNVILGPNFYSTNVPIVHGGEVIRNIANKVGGEDYGQLDLQVGANAGQIISIEESEMYIDGVVAMIEYIDVTNPEDAKKALDYLDSAIDKTSFVRSTLGAYQNRLEHTSNNISVSEENMTASMSRIQDADMAEEMAEYTKNNVITQAAIAMLAQANQRPSQVLQLLQR